MTYPTPPGEPGGYGTPPPPPDPPVAGYPIPGYYATPDQAPAQYPQQYQYQYQQPQPYQYPYGWQPQRPTEGMAIAALVVSCVGVVGLCSYGIGGIMGVVGAILGHVARRRIRRNGTDGAGLALAGIIVGWCLTGISAIIAGLVITLIITDPGS
jgi:Domain of unknown function (DUF4190)